MAFQVGDVVNGHELGPDNQWHPVEPPSAGQSAPPPPAPPAASGAMAAPMPPAPSRKKPLYKRWWFILLALVVLFFIFKSVTGGGSSETSTSASPPAAAPAVPAAPGLNTPVRDGDFEFTATKVQCGVPSVGTSGLGKAAQGQFCLVTMNVKNIGKDAQVFDSSSQKALDAQGNKLSADGGAAVYIPESKSLFNNINPGNQVSGVVVFDIPKTATLAQLELHDSMFSDGAKVKVS